MNGDAEANVGADDETMVVKPRGWQTTGQFGVFKYGGINGFPDDDDAGPPQRGRNFFTGGDSPTSSATQVVNVASAAGSIDAGVVSYALSAWLGGYGAQNDYATVKAAFLTAGGHEVGIARVGPVSAAERSNVTAFAQRVTMGTMPRGTRSVRVTICAKRVAGTSNDGYVDDVSFVLTRRR